MTRRHRVRGWIDPHAAEGCYNWALGCLVAVFLLAVGIGILIARAWR